MSAAEAGSDRVGVSAAPGSVDRPNVFISYSRADLATAERVVKGLELHDIDCMIDLRDLPYGERWQAELLEFIRAADAVVFLVSPHSVSSQWCQWELTQIASLSKRLLPVLIEPTALATLPPTIAEIHLLSLTIQDAFDVVLPVLARSVHTDLAWVKEHTRLADRAARWAAKGGLKDHLLRGRALRDAEEWRLRRPTLAPELSQQQLAYLLASQSAGKSRQRWQVGIASSVTALATALAAWALDSAATAERERRAAVNSETLAQQRKTEADQQRDAATHQRRLAEQNRELAALRQAEAERQEAEARRSEQRAQRETQAALRNQSLYLADAARQLYTQRRGSVEAALLALEALPDAQAGRERPYVSQAELQLAASMRLVFDQRMMLGHSAKVTGLAASPTGRWLVSGAEDRKACLWDTAGSTLLRCLRHDANVVRAAGFLPDESGLVTIDSDGTVSRWSSDGGQRLSARRMVEADLDAAAFSPDRGAFVIATDDDRIRVFDMGGSLQLTLPGPGQRIRHIAYSPDGRQLVAAAERSAYVWDATTGRLRHRLQGHRLDVNDASISPDGRLVATASSDHQLILWDARSGEPLVKVLRPDSLFTARFSPLGHRLLSSSSSSVTVHELQNLDPVLNLVLPGEPSDRLFKADWSADGIWIVAFDLDGPMHLWQQPPTTEALVERAKKQVPSCLSTADRQRYFLDPEPPAWCITMGKDNYTGPDWRDWLRRRQRGLPAPMPVGKR